MKKIKIVLSGYKTTLWTFRPNPLSMSEEGIRQYLKASYGVPDGLLPQYCVASSSGGLHCVWLTEDILDAEVRNSIARKMITFFGGDHNAVPQSHPYRVPKSFNCKKEVPTRSKLIKLCENDRCLNEKLADELKDLFADYTSSCTAFTSVCCADSFMVGFRLGARFAYDPFVENRKG